MNLKKVAFLLVTALLHQEGEGIDACEANHGTISLETTAKVDREWIITARSCITYQSILLLRLADIRLSCWRSLTISKYLSGASICQYPKGTCFLFTTNQSAIEPVFASHSDCQRTEWIVKTEILPISIRFEKPQTRWEYGFELQYSYFSNDERAIQTEGVTSKEIITSRSTLAGTSMPMTFGNETTVSDVSASAQSNAGYVAAVAVLTVLLLASVITIIFLVILTRTRRCEPGLKVHEPQEQADGAEEKATYNTIYHEGNGNGVYHEVDFDREIVDNELYGS